MNGAEPLLEAVDLGKKYARSLRASMRYGVRDVISEALGTRDGSELREEEFWALRDVNFALRRGECLAVLGANGAGKSTLLKLLSGILAPDRGSVKARGRIEKMIELTAGMSPTLTGRENVALRCRLLGLDRADAQRRLDEVIAFAELDEFIDTPIQYYSSGMSARLGFATTVVMAPDILLIDEVLAVGDLRFRMKCYERVDEMRRGSAVILVTHGMNQAARMATSALVLHKGLPVHHGSVQGGIAKYQELAGSQSAAKEATFHPDQIDFALLRDGEPSVGDRPVFQYGDELRIEGSHRCEESLELSVILHEGNGPTIADWHSARSGFRIGPGQTFALDVGRIELCPGFYQWVVVGFAPDGTQRFLSRPKRFKVEGLHLGTTRLQPRGSWSVSLPHVAHADRGSGE
jgi:lipopolysaccharide transport system ATP-binding protein